MLERLQGLYPLFILAGLVIGGVLFVLHRLARERDRVALDLIRLNETLGFDLFPFLEGAADRLILAGFQGMAWEIDWFGSTSRGEKGDIGNAPGSPWERDVTAPDIAVRIRLHPGKLAGERRFLALHLCETLVLLLKTDAWIKAGSVASALSEFQRLTLFLGHDVKNLAQFVRIASDQIESLPAEEEQRYLDQLRSTLPLFRERSERIIQALTRSHPPGGEPADIALAATIERLCAAQEVPVRITGDAVARVQPASLDGILDNLIRNHDEHASGLALQVEIHGAEDTAITRITSGKAGQADLLRLFEPFWTSSATGLGLGLYQARQLALEQGGNLNATVHGGRLCFELRLPSAS
ncbi:MAG TPA: ATP-binding protein [Rhodocyclaceae bacterium]|nr:ATP-binding protein [Rhodocyclaceae bacterium]